MGAVKNSEGYAARRNGEGRFSGVSHADSRYPFAVIMRACAMKSAVRCMGGVKNREGHATKRGPRSEIVVLHALLKGSWRGSCEAKARIALTLKPFKGDAAKVMKTHSFFQVF